MSGTPISSEAEIVHALHAGSVPPSIAARLGASRAGTVPWIASLTPGELRIARSHGLRPIATVSATCWLLYASWTLGHIEGWHTALQRLRDEAVAAGAHAVVDVKLRTVKFNAQNSMDFTLVGTAVRLAHGAPSPRPIVATLPALEFVKLIEAGIVPTGIAVGAAYDWLFDQGWRQSARYGNVEVTALSSLVQAVQRKALDGLRANAAGQGNGVLAHVNFGEVLTDGRGVLARHIVVATTVDADLTQPFTHAVVPVVDLRDASALRTPARPHHQSYAANDQEGAI